MKHDQLKVAGLVTMAITGFVHLIEAPEYFDEQRYIGVLFAVSALGAVISLVGIVQEQRWGWMLGLAVAAGCLAGYVLSRTVGLPSFREASWAAFLEPMGLISLIAEALFILSAAIVVNTASTTFLSDEGSTGTSYTG